MYEVVDRYFVVFIAKFSDRRDDGRCTGTECFLQCSVMAGFHQIVDGKMFFVYFVAPGFQDLNDGVTCNARQNSAVARCGDDFIVDHEHDIHRSYFFDVFTLHAVQPQYLCIAQILCLYLCGNAGRIVAAAFCEAGTAAGRTHVFVFDIDPEKG